MTSARKRFANRANARKSTGPKTAAGKARVSRNALRHGFSRRAFADGRLRDAQWERAVAVLALTLAGAEAPPARLARAAALAAAQHDLLLVRRARRALEAAGYTPDDRAQSPQQCIDPALLARITRLDRYERRALARRRRAIAAFEAPAPAGNVAKQSQPAKA